MGKQLVVELEKGEIYAVGALHFGAEFLDLHFAEQVE
jgi:hypothetical protein